MQHLGLRVSRSHVVQRVLRVFSQRDTGLCSPVSTKEGKERENVVRRLVLVSLGKLSVFN